MAARRPDDERTDHVEDANETDATAVERWRRQQGSWSLLLKFTCPEFTDK